MKIGEKFQKKSLYKTCLFSKCMYNLLYSVHRYASGCKVITNKVYNRFFNFINSEDKLNNLNIIPPYIENPPPPPYYSPGCLSPLDFPRVQFSRFSRMYIGFKSTLHWNTDIFFTAHPNIGFQGCKTMRGGLTRPLPPTTLGRNQGKNVHISKIELIH